MQKSEIVKLIRALRARGYTDTQIVEFLLEVEAD